MIQDVSKRTVELSEICKLHHVARLDIYGEAATANFLSQQGSLTFVMELLPLPPGDYVDAYFGLLESLEQLFEQPVELATDSAIENPYFRQIVEDSRINVYAA